jgi:hypothetical protein
MSIDSARCMIHGAYLGSERPESPVDHVLHLARPALGHDHRGTGVARALFGHHQRNVDQERAGPKCCPPPKRAGPSVTEGAHTNMRPAPRGAGCGSQYPERMLAFADEHNPPRQKAPTTLRVSLRTGPRWRSLPTRSLAVGATHRDLTANAGGRCWLGLVVPRRPHQWLDTVEPLFDNGAANTKGTTSSITSRPSDHRARPLARRRRTRPPRLDLAVDPHPRLRDAQPRARPIPAVLGARGRCEAAVVRLASPERACSRRRH